MTKPIKYNHDTQIWYKSDIFKTCKKNIIKCQQNYIGHFSEHLNQNKRRMQINEKTGKEELHLQVDYFVHHSHFIADIDKGRHVRCKIGSEYIPVSHPSIRTMYRLSKRDPPEWIREELGY